MTGQLIKSKRLWVFVALLLLICLFYIEKCTNFTSDSLSKNGIDLNQSYAIVPQNATFICVFNLSSILDEIEYEKLRSTQSYIDKLKSFYHQNPPFTQVFSNPEAAGINPTKKAVFYIDVGHRAADVYSASILSLADETVFSQMVSKTTSKDFEERDHYKYARVDSKSSVAWNKQFAMFITTDPGFDNSTVLKNCFNPRKKKYIHHSSSFAGLMNNSSTDASFWIDLESYSNNQIHATDARGEFDKDLLKGNYLYGNIDFLDGAIELDVQFELNNKIRSLLQNVFKADFDKDIIKDLPEKTPSFLANLSLNIDGLLNFLLRDVNTKIEARNSLIEYGLVLDDFTQAFTGDVLFASYPSYDPVRNSALFAAKINDRSHFNNLLKVWEDIQKIEAEGDGIYKVYTGAVAFFPFVMTYEDNLQRMLVKDDYVYVSLDKNMIDTVASSQGKIAQGKNHFLPVENGNNYLSILGNKEFSSVTELANQLSIKTYKLKYNGKQLFIQLTLSDEVKPALKQLLSLS